jgi:hypothetical protein
MAPAFVSFSRNSQIVRASGTQSDNPSPLIDAARALIDMPEDTLEQIAAKRVASRELAQFENRVRLLYRCLLGAQDRAVDLAKLSMPLTDHAWSAARGQTVYGPLVAIVDKIANDVGAFHWPIEFPHIFARQRARVSNE